MQNVGQQMRCGCIIYIAAFVYLCQRCANGHKPLFQRVMAHLKLSVLLPSLTESIHYLGVSFLDWYLQAEKLFKTETHVDMTNGLAFDVRPDI